MFPCFHPQKKNKIRKKLWQYITQWNDKIKNPSNLAKSPLYYLHLTSSKCQISKMKDGFHQMLH